MRKEKMIRPYPGMKIYEDVSFLPGVYNFYGQKGITICASNITISGNGCVFIGGKDKSCSSDDSHKTEFSYGYGAMLDEGLGYHGIGIYMEHVHDVKIEHLQVRGFVQGLYMKDCNSCVITENDFSYNYHNPDWGWEEHIDAGGIVLYNSHHNKLFQNKAVQVWSALVLRNADHNEIKRNDFSHTSNVGLRCWMASYNLFEDNDFSWGIRKEANEVHARDSSCVLIESASNYNIFRRNDMRYGGDGLFIRSLNNLMSMYNLFEENDASFANNNAIEAWDAHNTYLRNKANYSSYGFWLGCSDHTKLIENEVIGNGVVFQNAPESFGNAGIAVVNGSGNDFYLKSNLIKNNHGPGIAIRYTKQTPSRNWILEKNTIVDNQNDERGFLGYGIYMKNAMNIHLIDNIIQNEAEAIYRDEHVTMIHEHSTDTTINKIALTKNCVYTEVGKMEEYQAEGFDTYAYYFDDGYMSKQKGFQRTFDEPGRYRMFVNAQSVGSIGLLEENIYVRDQGFLSKEWLDPEAWIVKERNQNIQRIEHCGVQGLALCMRNQKKSSFTCQLPLIHLADFEELSFFYCYQNDFIDWNQEVRLHVTLLDETGGHLSITSKDALFQKHAQANNEAKYEWEYLTIPLRSHEDFLFEYSDDFIGEVYAVCITFETPQPSTGQFLLADAVWKKKRSLSYQKLLNAKAHQVPVLEKRIRFSSNSQDQFEIWKEHPYQYDLSKRWISAYDTTEESITIDVCAALPVDGVDIAFYADEVTTLLPENIHFLCDDQLIATLQPQANHVKLRFPRKKGKRFLLKMEKRIHTAISIYDMQLLLLDGGRPVEIKQTHEELFDLEKAMVKLNKETWGKDAKAQPLHYQLYDMSHASIQTATCINENTCLPEQIRSGKETELSFQQVTLKKGTPYALLLYQDELANGVQGGSYYRWVGNGIAPLNGTYGYWNGDEVISKDMNGWGECYLKLYDDKDIYDHSTEQEGLGNRLGVKGMEKLYQCFTIPNTATLLQQVDYLRDTGLRIHGTLELSIKWKQPETSLLLYFKTKEFVEAILDGKHVSSKDGFMVLTSATSGWCHVTLNAIENELLMIKELEDYDDGI